MPTDVSVVAKAAQLLRHSKGPLHRALVVGWVRGKDLSPRDFPLIRSDYYGSSVNFEYDLRLDFPDLLVPERQTVLAMGAQYGWSPECEAPPAKGEPCPRCRDAIGPPSPPEPGKPPEDPTLFVCPKCHRSGFDHKLARQRELAGDPPPHVARRSTAAVAAKAAAASKVPAGPDALTRKQARAKRFSQRLLLASITGETSIKDDLTDSRDER